MASAEEPTSEDEERELSKLSVRIATGLLARSQEKTDVVLDSASKVLRLDGQHVLASDLRPGDQLVTLDHGSLTLVASEIVTARLSGSVELTLDRPAVAVFVATQPASSWTTLLLPSGLICLPELDDGKLASAGSRGHAGGGACLPCVFYLNRGCRDGILCSLCHFPHHELSRSAMQKRVRKQGRVPVRNHLRHVMSARSIATLRDIFNDLLRDTPEEDHQDIALSEAEMEQIQDCVAWHSDDSWA